MKSQISHQDYMSRVFRHCGELQASSAMMRDAFEATERELVDEFGGRRYSNYDSFMAGKSRQPRRGYISASRPSQT